MLLQILSGTTHQVVEPFHLIKTLFPYNSLSPSLYFGDDTIGFNYGQVLAKRARVSQAIGTSGSKIHHRAPMLPLSTLEIKIRDVVAGQGKHLRAPLLLHLKF